MTFEADVPEGEFESNSEDVDEFDRARQTLRGLVDYYNNGEHEPFFQESVVDDIEKIQKLLESLIENEPSNLSDEGKEEVGRLTRDAEEIIRKLKEQ